MSGAKRALVGLVVAAVAVPVVYLAVRLLRQEEERARSTPYQYDVSAYMKVPENLIGYNEVKRIRGELDGLTGIALDSRDNIYVAVDKAVVVLNPEGVRQKRLELNAQARCLAVDKDGTIYVGMQDHVVVCASSGERRAEWGSLGDKAVITSIAVGTDDVFVADYGNRVVWRFDTSGALRGKVGEGRFVIPSPFFDVGLGSGGALWAANTGKRQVENYSYDGTLEKKWGTSSMELEGFCGCCNPSHFAIGADGSFVTSEKGLPRIKVYDSNGTLLSVVAGPEAFDEGTTGVDLAVDSKGRILAIVPNEAAIRVFEKKRGK
ncbi:NHL repeat-containing protein [Planctomycetota bacterium]